jgi:putative transposase
MRRRESENFGFPLALLSVALTGRRLPHLHVIGQPTFITFRLKDSLPLNRPFPTESLTSGQAFVTMDRLLDRALVGPTYLKDPAVAQVVVDSLDLGNALGHYELHAWVIMANHVHLLLTPHIAVSKMFGSLKTATATMANLQLNRTGKVFWQDESFDRLVRSEEEYRRILRYIENNPVAAGLVVRAEEYVWSSAGRPERPPQAGSLPHQV